MDVVVVTGFGPFLQFSVNSSWEVAKELQKFDFESHGIQLVTREIPVVYKTVSEEVPRIWSEYQPTLVVHIGVSAHAHELTLETCAHKTGYERKDINGKLPEIPKNDCPEITKPDFDLEKVYEQFSANCKDVKSALSDTAGRYLCEFTYYTSLCIDPSRTVFIHVPDIDKPYSVAEMAKGVREIVLLLVNQVQRKRFS